MRFFAPHTNTCFVFKFATDPFGQPSMQRNAAWEFLYAMECQDLMRPFDLLDQASPPLSY